MTGSKETNLTKVELLEEFLAALAVFALPILMLFVGELFGGR